MSMSIGVALLLTTAFTFRTEAAAKRKIYYMDFEHIELTYTNPKYIRDVNLTARRFGRNDPIHYVHIHYESLVPYDNNFLIDIYFHEFLSNEYRPSFVELHYKYCDLMLRDMFIGQFVNKHLPKTCPVPKGEYHMVNMSMPDQPLLANFPFQKARPFLFMAKKGPGGKRERVIEGHCDIVIKEGWR